MSLMLSNESRVQECDATKNYQQINSRAHQGLYYEKKILAITAIKLLPVNLIDISYQRICFDKTFYNIFRGNYSNLINLSWKRLLTAFACLSLFYFTMVVKPILIYVKYWCSQKQKVTIMHLFLQVLQQ